MNDQLDTGQDPPDSAEQLSGDPNDSQNGVTDPAPAQPMQQTQTPAQQQPTPTGRRSRSRTGAGAAPDVKVPGRARGKAGDIPDRFDAAASGAPKWSSHDADILWPEMIEWLTRKGRSPYDVTINVIRVEPPPRASVGEGFEANVAVGDGTSLTPGDAIKRIIEDYYHLPVSRTPAKYELQFVWRANSQYIAQGYLSCQSPAEIIALRNAAIQRRMHQQPHQQGFAAPMLPSPPQQPPPFQPQGFGAPLSPFGPFYPGYGPPPQQSQRDPELERRLSMLEDENRRLRAERNAPMPRPGVGAPVYHTPTHQPPVSEEEREARLVTRVIGALRAAGLGAPAPAAAPAAASGDMITTMRQGLAVMREFRRFSEEAGGMFEPDNPEPRQLPAGSGEMAPPDDDMPYQITDLPSQWGDGSKAKLVRDKETGKVDLLGMALMNPYPSQKIMDAGATFMQRMSQRGLGRPRDDDDGDEEVPEIRQQQPPQQQQQQQLPSPPQEEQPNGTPSTSEPGWDNLT